MIIKVLMYDNGIHVFISLIDKSPDELLYVKWMKFKFTATIKHADRVPTFL